MRVGITGVTGLLGRNLFFEFLKQFQGNLNNIEFILLGRSQKDMSFKERIIQILKDDGRFYLKIDERNIDEFIAELTQRIKFIELELTDESYNSNIFDGISSIDYFYHIAALTDFRTGETITRYLNKINVEGTAKVLELLRNIKIGYFNYTGSVYSAGHTKGVIEPDYYNENADFRNPYEKTKLFAEKIIKEYSKKHNINSKIFRTSTIAGRLIEDNIGFVCKYDVFYAWAAFFLRYKFKKIKNWEEIYSKTVGLDVRFHMNSRGSQNIMPADYGAKLLYYASNDGCTEKYFSIVNDVNYNNISIVKKMLEMLNCDNFSFVDELPDGFNALESLYYKTVGKIYTPYILDDEIFYDNSNLDGIRNKYDIQCPLMTDENFEKLFQYAIDNYFGFDVNAGS